MQGSPNLLSIRRTGYFAPVWTTLFVLMAFSVWRILRLPRTSARRTALALFFIQLALNAAWSWMFFAADSPALGMVNIVPQWLIIIATIVAFYRLDKIAAWCLFPLGGVGRLCGGSQSGDLAAKQLKPRPRNLFR